MMQEDSNGESSFEFVHKKVDSGGENLNKGISVGHIGAGEVAVSVPPSAASTPAVNLLSSVAPPASLPSFVMASTDTPQPAAMSVTHSDAASGMHPPVQAQPEPTFSAAIPQSIEPVLEKMSENHAAAGGLLGWVKDAVGGAGILSRVAEKAKSSVDSMITTLDPQMREFIYSGGDVDIIIASDKEVKVSPLREAFQSVFGRATVTGLEAQASMVAAQPVGFAAGTRAAEERIAALRQSGKCPDQIPVVAVENFLLEVAEEKWFDVGVLVLDDPAHKICLHTFTQLMPVPARVVERAQADTSADYPLRWSGLAVPIGKLMAEHLQVSRSEWHEALSGVTRREMLLIAGRCLAGLYKNALKGSSV